jgi:hypothetical protein
MAVAMLTLAVAFLFLSIFAAVFGAVIAGPAGLIAAAGLLAAFLITLGMYLRDRHRGGPPAGKDY